MKLSTMMMLFLVSLLASTKGARVVNKVTPVEKVIELLEKLSDETAAEGQREAKDYDKFACFCKEQADNKLYAITKSKEKIDAQSAKIDKLDTEMTELNSKISELTETKEDKEQKQKEADEQRASEFATYSEREKQLAKTINAIEGAIQALEESKKGMTDSKLNLAQFRIEVKKIAKSKAVEINPERLEAVLAAFDAKVDAPGKPHASEYASNDIISTLKGLRKQFKEDKNTLDTDEASIRNDYEMAKQANENEIKFTTDDIDEKKSLVDGKSKEKMQLEEARTEETTDMNADQKFMDDLTKKCEDKAKNFDQRSNARTAELTAITKALGILKEGAQPNYDANGKLAMLIQPHSGPAEAQAEEETFGEQRPSDISFVQLRGATRGPSQVGLDALTLLTRKAHLLESPALSMLSVKVQLELGKDHFVKVRQMIKDLIAKLEDDAESEAEQKGFCDKKMAKFIKDRDESTGKVEMTSASIDKTKSAIAKLSEEIEDLTNSMADLRKSLFEQTELRNKEREENMKTIGDSEAGLEAVKGAIEVLKKFYGGAFVQQKFTPEGADRDGNTVDDLAPATASGEYKGNQDAAQGIFGLLEVIQSDFERTIGTTKDDEEKAQTEFEEFEGATKEDLGTQEKTKDKKEKAKQDSEADLTMLKDELKDAQELVSTSKEELEKLKPLCVDAGESWEQKRARQEKEIEALKEALAILSEI